MRLAIRNPNLAANVILYGTTLVTEPAEMGSLGQNVPILGIFGEKDCSIQLSEVYAFEEATPTSNTIPS